MAVGDCGTILRTTNGGTTWIQLSSGIITAPGILLTDISFPNSEIGIVIGWYGIILKTTNGGNTWVSQTSGITSDLSGVSFTSANIGTIVGRYGRIYRTTNGGTTWMLQASGTTNWLNSVSFTDANTGTVVGDLGTILRTTNGGIAWTSQTSGTTNKLNRVSFTDANTGTVVGDLGTILRTTNGGATWISQASGTTNSLESVSFADVNTGIAVGSHIILKTTNGGTNWTTQINSGQRIFCDAELMDTNNGMAVGIDGDIYKTTNGGTTWTLQFFRTDNILMGIELIDSNTGVAVGVGGTIISNILTMPTLIHPVNGRLIVNNFTPDLSWQQYNNANYFHIQIDNDSTFSNPVAEELNWLTLNYTPTLPSFGKYYWRVRAHTIDNNWSPWSEVWSFTITDAKIVIDSIAVSSGGSFTSYLPNDAPINVGDVVRMKCRLLTPTDTPIPNALVDVLDQTIYNIEIGDSGIVSTVSDSNGEFYYPDADGYVQSYSGLVGLVFNPKGTENLTPLILRVYSDSLLIDNINGHMQDQLQLAHLQGISTEFDSMYFFYDEDSPLNVPITAIGDSMSYSKSTLESIKQQGVINNFMEGISSLTIMQSVLPTPFSYLTGIGFNSYLERRRQFMENLPSYSASHSRFLNVLTNSYRRYVPVVKYYGTSLEIWQFVPYVIQWGENFLDIYIQKYRDILCPANPTPGCQEMCYEWINVLKKAAFFIAEEAATSEEFIGPSYFKQIGLSGKFLSIVESAENTNGYIDLMIAGKASITQSIECVNNSIGELRGMIHTSLSGSSTSSYPTLIDSVYGPAIVVTLIDAVQFSDGVEFNLQSNRQKFGERLDQDTIKVIIQTPTQCFSNDGNPVTPTVTMNSSSPIVVIDLGYNQIAGKYEYEAKFAISLANGSTNTINISGQDIVGNDINYTSYFEWETVIPPAGGSINLQNGLSISVPTGGFIDSTQVSLIPVTSIYANKTNHFVYSALLDASSQFILPAQLTLPFDQVDSLTAENLKVYKLDEQNQIWVNIPNSTINYQNKIISASISESGIYAVGDTSNTLNIVLSPTVVNFDSTLPGTTQDKIITIINSVNSTNPLIAEATEPNDPFSFVGSGGPFTISPGMSQQITLRFSPVSYNSSFDKIVITHNAPGSIDTIPIYGVSLLPGMILRDVNLNSNWNLLSLPVKVLDGNPALLFPSAISPAYGFQGSYYTEDTLKSVVGYWLKFPTSETIELGGYPFVAETIAVTSGWNIIGSLSSSIPLSMITSIPGGLITSQFYGYQPIGYYITDSVRTGNGYWVKLTQQGQLVLSNEGSSKVEDRIRIININEMPPPPPDITEVEGELPLPTNFAIEQNYPNPFNPSTTIKFSIPKEVQVNISLYNILGERVKELKNEMMKPGYYEVEFNAATLASGIYLYRIKAGNFIETKKMVLIK